MPLLMQRKRPDAVLKPAKYCGQLFVAWKSVPNYHGVLTIEIRHTKTEIERYVLQQVPKKFYLQILCLPEPEQTMNQLLRCYLGDGSQ